MTTAGKAGFITALYIILVPLMGHFMGHKVPRIIVICVTWPLPAFISYASTAISRFLSATSWSSAVPSSSPCTSCHRPFPLEKSQQHQVVLGPVRHGLPLFRHLDSPLRTPDWSALWAAKWPLLYAGGLSSGVAYTLQIVGQKYTEPTTATLIMSLESVFAARQAGSSWEKS